MSSLPEKPNFIIFISDQQRSIQHFPDDWVKKYLPNLTKLMKQKQVVIPEGWDLFVKTSGS